MSVDAFEFKLSTRIVFETGAIGRLCGLPEVTGRRCMLLKFPAFDAVALLPELESISNCLIVPDNFEENPSVDFVRELAKSVVENNIQTIIAIGGGSSIDTAKAAAWFAKNPNWNLIGENSVTVENDIAIVAVPTTAGTGSDVTPYSILTDSEHKKRILNHPSLTPSVALCDPELTVTMPPHVTAHTGIDAICHAIEAYLSKQCNGLLADMALASVERGIRALPAVLKDPYDIAGRSEMMVSALEGGIVLAHCGTVMVHALGYCLTGAFGYQHGLSNAILLAAFIDVLSEKGCERAIKVSNMFDNDLAGFIYKCGIDEHVPAIDSQTLKQWAQAGYDSYGRSNCVMELTFKDIETILTKSLEIR
jgi:alcohol dehydrogenase